jgi:gamma-glutamyltranspeptidase / glutathione hydrolase
MDVDGQTRSGTRGVVSGGHPVTVGAAIEVLRAGGNAYDAAVASGFAAAVAEPCLSSLGGGGFLLARTASGEEVLFDFFVDTPGRGAPATAPVLTPITVRFKGTGQVFHVGHGSVAVPGALAGYLHVHRRLGRLELAEVIAPARRAAEQGVVLGAAQAAVARLLEPIFELTAEGRASFVPGDRPFGDADRYANPRLAAFLAEVAAGSIGGFGDAPLATAIAAGQAAHGGLVTAQDLAGYQVVERAPLAVDVRGARLLTNPPPSFGGRLVTRALKLLEREGPAGPAGSGPRLVQLAHALDVVAQEHTRGPAMAAGDEPGDATEGVAPPPEAGRPTGRRGDGLAAVVPDRRLRSSRGTTHVSIADAEGNLASMTTSNGSGSGVTLGETGVFANNIMGEEDLHPRGFHLAPPGVRVGSMMAPSVLLQPGAPALALGSGGSERIRSALTQVLAHLLDDGLPLAEAVKVPRIHWDGRTVQVEPGLAPESLAALAAARPLNVWEVTDLYFGGVNAVDTAGDRVGDHRRGGTTATLDDARAPDGVVPGPPPPPAS